MAERAGELDLGASFIRGRRHEHLGQFLLDKIIKRERANYRGEVTGLGMGAGPGAHRDHLATEGGGAEQGDGGGLGEVGAVEAGRLPQSRQQS